MRDITDACVYESKFLLKSLISFKNVFVRLFTNSCFKRGYKMSI